jgi:hypothetical protein
VSHCNKKRAFLNARFSFSTNSLKCKKFGENGYAYKESLFLIICPAFVKVRVENKIMEDYIHDTHTF